MLGLAAFTVGSLACAAAPAIWVLLAGRAVTGLGAALMMPSRGDPRGDSPGGRRAGCSAYLSIRNTRPYVPSIPSPLSLTSTPGIGTPTSTSTPGTGDSTSTGTTTPTAGIGSPTPTRSATPTPTVTPTVAPARVGDCNADRAVKIEELILGVGIALGSRPVSDCLAFDRDSDGAVAISELISGVNKRPERMSGESALSGFAPKYPPAYRLSRLCT